MLQELLEHLKDLQAIPWTRVGPLKLVCALGAVALMLLVRAASADGWVAFLDGLNLVFHEAGHPLFSLFGDTIGFLGGTLMQLLVPLAVAVSLWGKRQAVATGLAGVWFFENGFNIARYMADARSQLLPLVGGGEHDWGTLLGRWGLLRQDKALSGTLAALSWLGILLCCAWLVWRWWSDRQRPPD
nr:hypothetical protein [uncultured Holophaga sp.]